MAAHFEIGDIPAIARDFRTEGSEGYRTIINLAWSVLKSRLSFLLCRRVLFVLFISRLFAPALVCSDTELRAGEPSHAKEEAACRAAGIDWVHLPVASLCAIDGPCAVAFFRTIGQQSAAHLVCPLLVGPWRSVRSFDSD